MPKIIENGHKLLKMARNRRIWPINTKITRFLQNFAKIKTIHRTNYLSKCILVSDSAMHIGAFDDLPGCLFPFQLTIFIKYKLFLPNLTLT
jgi:hypothetical protein